MTPEKNRLHCMYLHKAGSYVVLVLLSTTGDRGKPEQVVQLTSESVPLQHSGHGGKGHCLIWQIFHLRWLEQSWWVKTNLTEPMARTAGYERRQVTHRTGQTVALKVRRQVHGAGWEQALGARLPEFYCPVVSGCIQINQSSSPSSSSPTNFESFSFK